MPVSANEFKEAFEAAFIVNRKHIWWNTNGRRTAQMLAYIYRTVADSFLGLEIEYEHSNIDAVLYQNSLNSTKVAIEHENDVKTIATELNNFDKHHFPLNVLITYTGKRSEYLLNRHSSVMSSIAKRSDLMLILNPETHWPDKHQKGEKIPWEYYLWRDGNITPV